jgi:ParB-like chromosome segregation protein Spo0J
MDIRDLPIEDIILDPKLYIRDHIDTDTVERYADAWSRLPPVVVYEVRGRWLLADGFHRHAAALMLKLRKIPAEVRKGTMDEALDFVAGANLFHGLPLTRAERRKAIELKLKLHHERSDRHLAEELAVGRELVAKIRRQLTDAGQIPAGLTRVGADGKTYPAAGHPKDPNERKPKKGEIIGDEPPPRGRREPVWEEPREPLTPVGKGGPKYVESEPEPRAAAMSAPARTAAPTIEEMLALMTKQIIEVVNWTMADGFVDAYKAASPNARGLFQTASIKLAARADQLRRA